MQGEDYSGVLIYRNNCSNLTKSIKTMDSICQELILINLSSSDNSITISEKFVYDKEKLVSHLFAETKEEALEISLNNSNYNKILISDAKYNYSPANYQRILSGKKKPGVLLIDKKKKRHTIPRLLFNLFYRQQVSIFTSIFFRIKLLIRQVILFSIKLINKNNEQLIHRITTSKYNLHIAIIPDGNRRFCSSLGANKKLQHLIGALKMEEIIYYCFNHPDIKYLTLDAFLENNWKRSDKEVNQILNLSKKFFTFISKFLKKCPVTVKICSTNTNNFSPKLIDTIKKIEQISSKVKNPKLEITILFSYSGTNDIINACKKIIEDNITSKEVNAQVFKKYLTTIDLPPVDIIVRTGKNTRLSDFILFDSAYSEIFFLEKMFPQLKMTDLDRILTKYKRCQKNFGK